MVPLSILTKGNVKYCPLTLIQCFMNAQTIFFLNKKNKANEEDKKQQA